MTEREGPKLFGGNYRHCESTEISVSVFVLAANIKETGERGIRGGNLSADW